MFGLVQIIVRNIEFFHSLTLDLVGCMLSLGLFRMQWKNMTSKQKNAVDLESIKTIHVI